MNKRRSITQKRMLISPYKPSTFKKGETPQYNPSLLQSITRNEFSEKELYIFRAVCFALFTVICFLFLLYLNYLLLGEFFTTVLLGIITSLALRPFKDSIVNNISNIGHNPKLYCMSKCLLFSSHIYIFQWIDLHNPKGLKYRAMRFIYVLISDFRALGTVCAIYYILDQFHWVLSKFSPMSLIFTTYFLFCGLLIVDFVIRCIFDIINWVTVKTHFDRILKHNAHTIATSFVMLTSTFLVFILVILLVILIITEIYQLSSVASSYLAKLTSSHIFETYFNGKLIPQMFDDFIRYAVHNYGDRLTQLLNVDVNLSQLVNGTNVEFLDQLEYLFNITIPEDILHIESEVPLSDTQIIQDESWFEFIFSAFSYTKVSQIIAYYWNSISEFLFGHFSNMMKVLNWLFYHSYSFIFGISMFFFSSISYYIIQLTNQISNIIFMIFIYLTLVTFLLMYKENILVKILYMAPFSNKISRMFEKEVIRATRGIFKASLEIFLYHILFTWLILDIFGVEFRYILTLLSGAVSIVPYISPWIMCLPACVLLYVSNGALPAFVFLAIYVMVIYTSDHYIYKRSTNTHPYLLGLSVVMGVYAFGVLGVLIGPLLLCLSVIIYHIIPKTYPSLSHLNFRNRSGSVTVDIPDVSNRNTL